MSELFIGLISGTSMDAVDAVLVDFTDKVKLIANHSEPLPEKLKQDLLSLCQPGHDEINRMGQLDIAIGLLFAEAANNLIKKSGINKKDIRTIGSHGQTIRHQPSGKFPFTLQIGDPNIIVTQTGITTIGDFRRRDMANGGQGAPLVPAFHHYLFQDKNKDRVILNIGGIANITILPANSEKVTGFDTGPGNTLLDAWIKKNLNKDYDKNGQWAQTGKVNQELLKLFLSDPYFQKAPPKSTGREYFNLEWLEKLLRFEIKEDAGGLSRNPRFQGRLNREVQGRTTGFEKEPPAASISNRNKNTLCNNAADIQATLTQLSAISAINAIHQYAPKDSEIYVCGGGAHNQYLLECLKTANNNNPIYTTEKMGVHPDWVEAIAFAWLAKQTLENKPGNLPAVTGAKNSAILGGIYVVTP